MYVETDKLNNACESIKKIDIWYKSKAKSSICIYRVDIDYTYRLDAEISFLIV